MQINRENYEAYFIDYLEGNLDERLVDDFIEFIKLNPDLKEELDLFESLEAIPETIAFEKKEGLYKEKYDAEPAFNDAAIARLEGDITEEEKSDFEQYLEAHPEKKKEAAAFAHTKLQADESILFKKKHKLYRRTLGKTLVLWSGSAAAILILAIAIFTFMDRNSNDLPLSNEIATIDDKVDKDEKTRTIKEEQEPAPPKKITPSDEKKEEVLKSQKVSPRQVEKKEIPSKKSRKSIRETTKGRMEEHDNIVMTRVPVEVPEELQAITASLDVMAPKASMATMYISYPEEYYDNERLIGEQVKEKINLRRISKAGLDLFASISNERFQYHTDQEGKVTEYKYDSRLLAFSLPGRKPIPPTRKKSI